MVYRLSRLKPTPLYYQIQEALREQIKSGQLKPHDVLPSEAELARQWGVTRLTVRRALTNLANEGLLVRYQGKGTFVADPKISRKITHLTGFTEDMVERGLSPGAKMLALEEVYAPEEVAGALGLDRGAPVIMVKRLRFADSQIVAIQTCYVPASLCPNLASINTDFLSLYEILEKVYGFVLYRGEQIVQARMPTSEEACLLEISSEVPVLHVVRTTYDENDTPIEYAHMVYRSDRFKLEMTLFRKSMVR